jgi:hypothetical protein
MPLADAGRFRNVRQRHVFVELGFYEVDAALNSFQVVAHSVGSVMKWSFFMSQT